MTTWTDDSFEPDNFNYGDNDDFEDEILNEERLLKNIDPDVAVYFSEARISLGSSNKIKKAKIVYESGQIVIYKGEKCTVIYGPYDDNGKTMYEISNSNGIISVDFKQLKTSN